MPLPSWSVFPPGACLSWWADSRKERHSGGVDRLPSLPLFFPSGACRGKRHCEGHSWLVAVWYRAARCRAVPPSLTSCQAHQVWGSWGAQAPPNKSRGGLAPPRDMGSLCGKAPWQARKVMSKAPPPSPAMACHLRTLVGEAPPLPHRAEFVCRVVRSRPPPQPHQVPDNKALPPSSFKFWGEAG